jgi:hypothetical protein
LILTLKATILPSSSSSNAAFVSAVLNHEKVFECYDALEAANSPEFDDK